MDGYSADAEDTSTVNENKENKNQDARELSPTEIKIEKLKEWFPDIEKQELQHYLLHCNNDMEITPTYIYDNILTDMNGILTEMNGAL